jgi:hypothetical protein
MLETATRDPASELRVLTVKRVFRDGRTPVVRETSPGEYRMGPAKLRLDKSGSAVVKRGAREWKIRLSD